MTPALSRRAFLQLIPATTAAGPLFAQGQRVAPRPFTVNIPKSTIDRIVTRVRTARWPDRLDAPDWRYGANWDYLKSLADYWSTRFDWRKAEAGLNRYPQFVARVQDFDVHFYHVKGRGPRPVPLILTHGWPGSVFEFLEALGPLTDPACFGGSAEDAFDVVVPSIPGFGFSSKPTTRLFCAEGMPLNPSSRHSTIIGTIKPPANLAPLPPPRGRIWDWMASTLR
jgi:hypothetical protein